MRQAALTFGVLCALLVGWLMHRYEQMRADSQERADFGLLARWTSDLISSHGSGVVDDLNGGRVDNFQAFYDYVKKTHPDVVANIDNRNPFPGLLPNRSYGHLIGHSSWHGDPLFFSADPTRLGFYHLVYCDGTVGVTESLKLTGIKNLPSTTQ